MKTTAIAAVSILASFASAQYYNVSSKPFKLVLKAENKTLNGAGLFACHEGAAIEGLCLGSKNLTLASDFTFNTSSYDTQDPGKGGAQGLLIYTLLSNGGTLEVPSPMQLEAGNIASNVAVPLFEPSESYLAVSFDKHGLLNIQSYIDDSVYPPNTTASVPYYRWQICETYVGYAYTTLAWVYGDGKPQNPTCQPVDVKRVYHK